MLTDLPVSTLETSQVPIPISTTSVSLCGIWMPVVSAAEKVNGLKALNRLLSMGMVIHAS